MTEEDAKIQAHDSAPKEGQWRHHEKDAFTDADAEIRTVVYAFEKETTGKTKT
jgi:hypothetical protein